MNKTLVILEPSMSGHRSMYLIRIIEYALRLEYTVKLVTSIDSRGDLGFTEINSRYATNSHFSVFVKEGPGNVSSKLPQPVPLFQKELNHWRWYRAVQADTHIVSEGDLLLLVSADNAMNIIGLLGSPFARHRWCGIIMKQAFHYEAMGMIGPAPSLMQKIKRRLFFRALDKSDRSLFLTIDASFKTYLDQHENKKYADKVALIPDPIDPIDDAQSSDPLESFPINDDDFVILVYGSLRKEKGVEVLLRVFPECDRRLKLILAGRQKKDIAKRLEDFHQQHPDCSHRVFEINRFVDPSEEKYLFNACHGVWLGYVNHFGMSAVLLQAAMYSKPVLASTQGLIGWYTEQYNLGVLFNTLDDRAVKAGLESALIECESKEIDRRYDDVVQQHTLIAFQESIFSNIQRLQALD